MSNQYIYSGDQTIVIQDGTILWNDQSDSNNQSALHYFDANDTIISDSTIDESYATAIDSNETQYLSLVEDSNSANITLEDLHNLTVETTDEESNIVLTDAVSAKLAESTAKENSVDDNNDEVIVFTLNGSDDLYGIQMIRDDDGNTQKYQFKFRKTPEGQLEPIPETVILLSSDEEQQSEQAVSLQADNEQTVEDEMEQQQEYFLVRAPLDSNCDGAENSNGETESISTQQLYIKGELTHDNVDSELIEESVDEDSCIQQEIMAPSETVSLGNNVKEEYFEQSDQFDENIYEQTIQQSEEEEHFMNTEEQNNYSEKVNEILVYEHNDENRHIELDEPIEDQQIEDIAHHFMSDNIEVLYETELEGQGRASTGASMHSSLENDVGYTDGDLDTITESVGFDSEGDQFDVADEIADDVVEDADVSIEATTDELLNESSQSSNILKHSLDNSEKDDRIRKHVNVNYYVVYPEKENVNSLAGKLAINSRVPVPKLIRTNPRSVLKHTFVRPKDKCNRMAVNFAPDCDLYHKRFAKNKDAMRAKHFHNFLNRTTIPHAPVRQKRQPRKQEIKPVSERIDEEIIVQQVIVSSIGFIESKTGKRKSKGAPIVELSDSEDDTSVQNQGRRKTQHLIRQTSGSEVNIIEIHSDNEDADSHNSLTNDKSKLENTTGTLKRRRGRPPKSAKRRKGTNVKSASSSQSLSTDEDRVVPQCNNSASTAEATKDPFKKELACPYCPKTFPSQNSLNTHTYHHNLENNLKNKERMSSGQSVALRQSLLPKFEYNHKCEKCQETFKNTVLLQKHNCLQKQALNCSVCLKQFRDITLLNIHKKSHAKSNLIKNTSIVKVSPKKVARPLTTLIKPPSPVKKLSPKKVAKQFKCAECPKVCDSNEKLTGHLKTHKRFICSSCFSTFSSKLLLDTHIRTNCVKNKTNSKRLSYSIRKSFVQTPPRRMSISKIAEKTLNGTLNNYSTLGKKLECDQCNIKFHTFRNLYTHKVQKHGMSTPDKSLMKKPKQSVYKPRAAHGGIPANDRLKKAYAELRKKLAETQDLNVQ